MEWFSMNNGTMIFLVFFAVIGLAAAAFVAIDTASLAIQRLPSIKAGARRLSKELDSNYLVSRGMVLASKTRLALELPHGWLIVQKETGRVDFTRLDEVLQIPWSEWTSITGSFRYYQIENGTVALFDGKIYVVPGKGSAVGNVGRLIQDEAWLACKSVVSGDFQGGPEVRSAYRMAGEETHITK